MKQHIILIDVDIVDKERVILNAKPKRFHSLMCLIFQ